MLANANNVTATSGAETQICSWTADGIKGFVGVLAVVPWGGEVRLYVDGTIKYVARATAENPTVFIADKEIVYSNGTALALKVYHDVVDSDGSTPLDQTVSGTLLGG